MGDTEKKELSEKLKDYKEWDKAAVFDASAAVLASTFAPDADELKEFLKAWDDRDTTVGRGFLLQGHHFDVHRWYETLIYGRRGDTERGEGICLMRVCTSLPHYLNLFVEEDRK
jgi:hypothetical protein